MSSTEWWIWVTVDIDKVNSVSRSLYHAEIVHASLMVRYPHDKGRPGARNVWHWNDAVLLLFAIKVFPAHWYTDKMIHEFISVPNYDPAFSVSQQKQHFWSL